MQYRKMDMHVHSCFSIEPGIYLERFGMRTEVDAVVRGGRLEVTGGPSQARLLDLGGAT